MSLSEVLSFFDRNRKLITRTAFGSILLCFFFPFVTISCQNQDVASLTGLQLGVGSMIHPPTMYGSYGASERYIPSEPLATFSLIAAAVGLAITFFFKKYRKELTG